MTAPPQRHSRIGKRFRNSQSPNTRHTSRSSRGTALPHARPSVQTSPMATCSLSPPYPSAQPRRHTGHTGHVFPAPQLTHGGPSASVLSSINWRSACAIRFTLPVSAIPASTSSSMAFQALASCQLQGSCKVRKQAGTACHPPFESQMQLGGRRLTRRCSGLASLAAELHIVRRRWPSASRLPHPDVRHTLASALSSIVLR